MAYKMNGGKEPGSSYKNNQIGSAFQQKGLTSMLPEFEVHSGGWNSGKRQSMLEKPGPHQVKTRAYKIPDHERKKMLEGKIDPPMSIDSRDRAK